MPSFKMEEVAQRLGVKKYWLQARLSADRRSPEPWLQYHFYRGITPVWTHDQLESLKTAISGELTNKRQPARNLRRGELPAVTECQSA